MKRRSFLTLIDLAPLTPAVAAPVGEGEKIPLFDGGMTDIDLEHDEHLSCSGIQISSHTVKIEDCRFVNNGDGTVSMTGRSNI